MTGTVVRFAPSPTGLLHLGHAYSALRAYDFARARGGAFLLRIEDIDAGRSRAEFIESIEEDLRWLGIKWSAPPLLQSTRRDVYEEALGQLQALGVVYPCFCTRKDIAAAAEAPHGSAPVYPGTCRTLPPPESDARRQSKPHAWRLDAEKSSKTTGALTFTDHGRTVAVNPALLGDVVVARKDAGTSYHLAATVDDANQGVTHIIRGTDLLPSTHVHRMLQALLGLPEPGYYHHPLLTGPDGQRLAKRSGARPLAELRAQGWTAEDVRRDLKVRTETLGAPAHRP